MRGEPEGDGEQLFFAKKSYEIFFQRVGAPLARPPSCMRFAAWSKHSAVPSSSERLGARFRCSPKRQAEKASKSEPLAPRFELQPALTPRVSCAAAEACPSENMCTMWWEWSLIQLEPHPWAAHGRGPAPPWPWPAHLSPWRAAVSRKSALPYLEKIAIFRYCSWWWLRVGQVDIGPATLDMLVLCHTGRDSSSRTDFRVV